MTEIFRNGKPIDADEESGAPGTEQWRAYRRFHNKRSENSSLQGGGKLHFGTPRLAKCRDLKVDGKRIK